MLLVALVAGSGACGSTREAADPSFSTRTDGALTVAADLPAPGFWNGATPGEVSSGFEHGLAEALADRFDLDLRLVDVPFADILAGDLAGADLALAQVQITDDRTGPIDFSIPYLDAEYGVVRPAGAEAVRDLAGADDLSWAVARGTLEDEFLTDVIDPDGGVLRRRDEVAAVDVVADGRADAALVDLPSALVMAGQRSDVEVVARVPTETGYGAVLPPDSAEDVPLVDAAIRSFAADGTLERLDDELRSLYATDPGDLPVIRHRS
jgi:polar amino acid transport system substrate-binding protein